MDMKQAIQRVADRQDLTGEEAGEVMELLLTGPHCGSGRTWLQQGQEMNIKQIEAC